MNPNSIVKVITVTSNGMMCGTGFFCKQAKDISGKHMLLTNAHVVSGAVTVSIRPPMSHMQDFAVKIHSVSTDLDLAVLELQGEPLAAFQQNLKSVYNTEEIPTLQLGNSDALKPFLGNVKVVSRGYPGGSEYMLIATGTLSGKKHIFGKPYLVSCHPINAGNSGGPASVKIDKEEFVVGINTMKEQGTELESLLIPSNTIATHLPEMLKERTESPSFSILRQLGIEASEEELVEKAQMFNEEVLGGYEKVRGEFQAVSFKDWHAKWKDEVGFHSLLSKVYKNLHSGDLAEIHKMRRQGWDTHLCEKCPVHKCATHIPMLYSKPKLGLVFSHTCGLAKKFYNTEHSGVIISDVLPNTLARGVKVMDYLTHVTINGGEKMSVDNFGEIYDKTSDLSQPIYDFFKPGQSVEMHIIRDGNPKTVSFDYSCDKKPEIRMLTPAEVPFEPVVAAGGIMLKQLRLGEVEQFQIQNYADPHTHNQFKLVVMSVNPRSSAFHTYSVRPGDVVMNFNGKELTSWKDFQMQEINSLKLESGRVVLFN